MIPDPDGVLDILVELTRRYKNGEIDAPTLDLVVQTRIVPQLNKACWCDYKLCCPAHERHVLPHNRCVLR